MGFVPGIWKIDGNCGPRSQGGMIGATAGGAGGTGAGATGSGAGAAGAVTTTGACGAGVT